MSSEPDYSDFVPAKLDRFARLGHDWFSSPSSSPRDYEDWRASDWDYPSKGLDSERYYRIEHTKEADDFRHFEDHNHNWGPPHLRVMVRQGAVTVNALEISKGSSLTGAYLSDYYYRTNSSGANNCVMGVAMVTFNSDGDEEYFWRPENGGSWRRDLKRHRGPNGFAALSLPQFVPLEEDYDEIVAAIEFANREAFYRASVF